MSEIENRKRDHLDLCRTDAVAFRDRTTLLEHVRLVHDALPEMAVDELDTRVHLFGKTLRVPLLIAAMTGGTDEAGGINRTLASIAEERGYAFGVGSQRAMQKNAGVTSTFAVRDAAPTALVFGNLGVVQATRGTTQGARALVDAVSADALCVHMNPSMELVQREGDRDFRGNLEALARLTRELGVPVIAKETGAGISGGVAKRLFAAGVRHVDVSGAGGTSWVGVEQKRAESVQDARGASLGSSLWDWGVPTAASIALVAPVGFDTVIATGGIKSGGDVARAIALGATCAGIARPVLQALTSGGRDGAIAFLANVEEELRSIMLLTGSRTLADLRRAPRIVTGELRDWMALAE